MARTDTLGHFLTDVADAIRTKTGGSSAIVASEFDTEIESIPSGGGETPRKSVVFYDYDGTKLYEYTKDEFLALESMPANPTHTGLTAQGWNWTLSDAKTYVTTSGMLDIGQQYITDDGKTRFYITLCEGRLSPNLSFYSTEDVVIDWGDGTSPVTVGGQSLYNYGYTHDYAQPGDYVITVSTAGSIIFYPRYDSNTVAQLFGKWRQGIYNAADAYVYLSAVKKIELGSNLDTNCFQQGCFGGLHNLETITIPKGISTQNIGNNAFSGCSELKSIIIPENIGTLGDSDFYNCSDLDIVSFPKNITSIGQNCFNGCQNLKAATLPPSLTTLGNNAFSGCKELISASICCSNITTIGTYIFANCISLRYVTLAGVVPLTDYMFNGCYSLESLNLSISPISIGASCFSSCGGLPSFTIPSSVISIGNSAFSNCSKLEEIVIPDGCTSIGTSTFSGCNNLKSITLPNDLETIPNGMLANCYNLKSINIPSTVTSIGSSAFSNCSSLKSIELPSLLSSIGENAFYGCFKLHSITIPSHVTSLPNTCFNNCRALEYITLHNGITSIGSSCFANCSCLREITLPSDITTVPGSCFSYCQALPRLIIPSGVTSIGNGCFEWCKGVTYYDFSNHTTIPTLSNQNAFSQIARDTKIVVPDDLYNDWRNAQYWNNLVAYIVKSSEYNF